MQKRTRVAMRLVASDEEMAHMTRMLAAPEACNLPLESAIVQQLPPTNVWELFTLVVAQPPSQRVKADHCLPKTSYINTSIMMRSPLNVKRSLAWASKGGRFSGGLWWGWPWQGPSPSWGCLGRQRAPWCGRLWIGQSFGGHWLWQNVVMIRSLFRRTKGLKWVETRLDRLEVCIKSDIIILTLKLKLYKIS